MARRNPANALTENMPLLLLLGGGIAAFVYAKKQKALLALSTVPPVTAASRMLPPVAPDGSDPNQLMDDYNQINSLMPTGGDMSGLGAAYNWAAQRGGNFRWPGQVAAAKAVAKAPVWGALTRSKLAGLQPSGALPGMGMGSFHLSHVFNNVVAKPIAQLTSGPLKIPLAIMTMGASLGIAKGVDIANAGITAVISKIDDPLMKAKQMVMSVVGGKAQPPANTAGTTITYLDCNGTAIDLATIQAQLSALAASGGATSITPTVDTAGNAVYRMPACPPTPSAIPPTTAPVATAPITAVPVTGSPSVATGSQINPATGLPYPIGTPINPYTGQAYINPATGQIWPPYTTIDPTTGLPYSSTSYPTSAVQPQQVPYQDAYGASGGDGGGGGYSYTDPATANSNIDPTTGLPYAQAPVATATTPDPTAVAPVPSKVSWLTVAGVALAVPAIMYVAHR